MDKFERRLFIVPIGKQSVRTRRRCGRQALIYNGRMVGNVLAALLIFLASVGPNVAQIDETRFRVTMVFDDPSPQGHFNAEISLTKAARKQCKGKGDAISEGTLYVNNAEPISGKRKALEVSEVYYCEHKG